MTRFYLVYYIAQFDGRTIHGGRRTAKWLLKNDENMRYLRESIEIENSYPEGSVQILSCSKLPKED